MGSLECNRGFFCLVSTRLSSLYIFGLAMSGPARVFCIDIPTIDRMTAALKIGKHVVMRCAEGDGTALLDIEVIASKSSVVIVDHRRSRKRKTGSVAHDYAATHLSGIFLGGTVLLRGIVARNGKAGTLGERSLRTGIKEEAGDFVASDGNCRSSVNIEPCVRLHQTHASVPVARALSAGNLNIRALELALASKNDARESVIAGRNRRAIDGEVTGGKAVRAVTREVNHGAILDIEVRAIRTVAGRVHDVDLRFVDRDDKRARKARTAVIGGVGRAAFDVHVVAAVAAIPLKSVLLVVLNGEIRAILQVKLIVATEINGMNVASAGTVHGKRSTIERERGILARAHRHPFPLGGIRSGANAGHACIDVLEHKRVAPKGNALVGELQRVAIAVDGEVLVQIKARSLAIGKELDGRAVSFLGGSKRFIERRILGTVEFGDLGSSFGSLGFGGGSGCSGRFRLRRHFDIERIIRIASRINAFPSSRIGRRIFSACRRIGLLCCRTTLARLISVSESDRRRKRKRQSASRHYAHRLLIERRIGFLHAFPPVCHTFNPQVSMRTVFALFMIASSIS